eukprot:m.172348 g.172348  ORF g.172348 m.172348 type:complete len:354 (+) comp18283_c0_seq2:246-1307(+)
MAEFALICATARANHINAYYAAIKDANANRLVEWNAALCIQRVWRGHHHREIVRKWRRCAQLIEKSFLAFKRKKELRINRIRELELRRHNAYHGGATKLQALWRGYRVRQDVLDFFKRKQYLASLGKTSEDTHALLQAHRKTCLQRIEEARQQEKDRAYKQRCEREHFMLSTQVSSGVYRKDSAEVSEGDLRATMRRMNPVDTLRRTRRRKSSGSDETYGLTDSIRSQSGDWKKVTSKAIVQGPFKSLVDTQRLRSQQLQPTLRVATDYEHETLARVNRKKKEWVDRVVDVPFIPTSTSSKPFQKYQKSLASSKPYDDPAKPNFRCVKPEDSKLTAFSTTLRSIPLFDGVSKR